MTNGYRVEDPDQESLDLLFKIHSYSNDKNWNHPEGPSDEIILDLFKRIIKPFEQNVYQENHIEQIALEMIEKQGIDVHKMDKNEAIAFNRSDKKRYP